MLRIAYNGVMSEGLPILKNSTEEVPTEELFSIFANDGPVDFSSVDRIKNWVTEGSEDFGWADHYLDKKIDLIEDKFSEFLKVKKEVSLGAVALFGELVQLRDSNLVSEKLAMALEEENVRLSVETKEEMVRLSGSDDEGERVNLHKILDFVKADMLTCQNIMAQGEIVVESSGFFADTNFFLSKKIDKPRNYLIKKHIQDLQDLRRGSFSSKTGVVPNIPGGASDETIYTYRHALGSYRNRIALGVNEGYPIKNPVLPIAPGFFAFYNNGRLANIFPDNGSTEEYVDSQENQYIKNNEPDDGMIYETLNDLPRSKEEKTPPMRLVPRLRDIFQFEKVLREEGRKFYYDLSKIDLERVHPFVVAELLFKNQEYKHREGKTKNNCTVFPKDKFLNLVFPGGHLTSEQIYNFEYLSKLETRKKIEDDFGIDLSEYDFWTQRVFLEFLETRDIENVEKLQVFVRKFGGVGLKTFLSLEYGRELGDDIIVLGEKLPKAEASRLFEKYGELVDAAEQAESYTGQFADTQSSEMAADVRENLLRKGRELLVSFATKVKSAKKGKYDRAVEDLEQELMLLRGDAALFAATFKELSKRGEQLNLAEVKDVEFAQGISPESFSEVDKERMKELYKINYATYPEFQKMLLESFERVLKEPTNRFYVLRYKGEIEGFYRLGIAAEDRVYFGAFNMNPKYAGSGLGEALMQQSLDVRARDSVIEASCTATLPIASNYIERGFIGTKAEQNKEVYSMDIVRNDSKKEMFHSKEISDEEIMRTCESGSSFVCTKVPLTTLAPEHFARLNEQAGDSRFVLTRYIRDKQTQSAYLVFEKTNTEAIEAFSSPEKRALAGGQE